MHINSTGGYLRNLTRKAARGEFSLGPMRMALLRLNENRCTVLADQRNGPAYGLLTT